MHIAITGAGGYIGMRLLHQLSKRKNLSVAPLFKSSIPNLSYIPCNAIRGDLLNPDKLSDWIVEGSTIVNLAYMWNAGLETNLVATDNLLSICQKVRAKRIIHISTAAVVGRAKNEWVDEQTPCNPYTKYGRIKFQIEQFLKERSSRSGVDLVILRPTSVFGPAGTALQKLCLDICRKPSIQNYLRACLFADRAMNLIHVDNVIEAISFAIDYPKRFLGETYIVSDDEDSRNNFLFVERMIREEFNIREYSVPIFRFPNYFLNTILRCMRRNIVDSKCRFRSGKIKSLGFVPPLEFVQSLRDYTMWARESQLQKADSSTKCNTG